VARVTAVSWEPLPGEVEHTRALSSVLGRVHRTLGFARPDSVRTLEQHWTTLLGHDLASRCELESLRHETLVVAVTDPAVGEHLRWSSREILDSVNNICGGTVADELQIRVRTTRG
jgi:hypothetical protein